MLLASVTVIPFNSLTGKHQLFAEDNITYFTFFVITFSNLFFLVAMSGLEPVSADYKSAALTN